MRLPMVLCALAALLLPAGCRRLEAERLYAPRLEARPSAGNWEEGVPLYLKAGGGKIHGTKSVLDTLDPGADPIHPSSASCHHGPPVTDPVLLEARAFYDERNLYVEVIWEDPTPDDTARRWRLGDEGWEATWHEGDGLAILWSRAPGRYGCQEACHIEDWAVRAGSVVDVRSMYLQGEGAWEEAWVWKAAGGTGALILGAEGFRTPVGDVYRLVNSEAALDGSLRPEVRRARVFGRDDRPLFAGDGGPLPAGDADAPAYLYGRQPDERLLDVEGGRRGGRWRVLFTRSLEAAGGRQDFIPGESYRFGVAVFDDTSLDHHIVRDTQTLTLALPSRAGREGGGAE